MSVQRALATALTGAMVAAAAVIGLATPAAAAAGNRTLTVSKIRVQPNGVIGRFKEITDRTAAGDAPTIGVGRQLSLCRFRSHHSWIGGRAVADRFSATIRLSRGIRKDSVLPDPVPEVTTGLCAMPGAKCVASAATWCLRSLTSASASDVTPKTALMTSARSRASTSA